MNMGKKFNGLKTLLLYLVIFYLLVLSLDELSRNHIIIGLMTMIIALIIQPSISNFFRSKNMLLSKFSIKYSLTVFAIMLYYLAKDNPDPIGLLFVLSNAIFIYLFYIILKSNYPIKNEVPDHQDIKSKLVSLDLYRYIVKFVEKNINIENVSDNEVILDYVDDKQIIKLHTLIESKDFDINIQDLKDIIQNEIKDKKYQKFKSLMQIKDNSNINELIIKFVDTFGYEKENNQKYIEFFIMLLKEKNIKFENKRLILGVEKAAKSREINIFEKKILESDNKQIMIDEIDNMTGHQFESFLKQLFERMGYVVKSTSLSRDQGADIIAEKLNTRYLIQSKRYNKKVSNKSVQEISAALKHYKADNGIVITNSYFTESAKELAKSNNIELIDRNTLRKLISDYL